MTEILMNCIERMGERVVKVHPGIISDPQMCTRVIEARDYLRITDVKGLAVGEHILAAIYDGWTLAKVTELDYEAKTGTATSKNTTLFLVFGHDDRNCWCCTGGGNLAAIKKLELFSKE